MDMKQLSIVDPNLFIEIALMEFRKIDTDDLGFFTREQFKRRWGTNQSLIEAVMGKKKTVNFSQFLTRFIKITNLVYN